MEQIELFEYLPISVFPTQDAGKADVTFLDAVFDTPLYASGCDITTSASIYWHISW